MVATNSKVVKLTQQLVQIASTNTTLSAAPGTGEREIAAFVSRWLRERGFELVDVPTKDAKRPSVLAVRRGTGGQGARSILFNGHIDTVSLQGYHGNGLSGEVRDGRVWGRGTADMKGGLAAAMVAAAEASSTLRGDVWLAAVADEEDASQGSYEVLQVCPDTVAGAIFPEPTDEDVVIAHRGFVWFNVEVRGRAAHGSLHQTGVDAIAHMGCFLSLFKRYCDDLLQREAVPLLGHGSAHTGTISGGEEPSTYPASCKVSIERRTLPGETDEHVEAELRELLESTRRSTPGLDFTLTKTLSRPPLVPGKTDFLDVASRVAAKHLGSRDRGKHVGGAFWTDASLFKHHKGIDSIVLGPKGEGFHTETEWVDISSLNDFVAMYGEIISSFCA